MKITNQIKSLLFLCSIAGLTCFVSSCLDDGGDGSSSTNATATTTPTTDAVTASSSSLANGVTLDLNPKIFFVDGSRFEYSNTESNSDFPATTSSSVSGTYSGTDTADGFIVDFTFDTPLESVEEFTIEFSEFQDINSTGRVDSFSYTATINGQTLPASNGAVLGGEITNTSVPEDERADFSGAPSKEEFEEHFIGGTFVIVDEFTFTMTFTSATEVTSFEENGEFEGTYTYERISENTGRIVFAFSSDDGSTESVADLTFANFFEVDFNVSTTDVDPTTNETFTSSSSGSAYLVPAGVSL